MIYSQLSLSIKLNDQFFSEYLYAQKQVLIFVPTK